MSKLLFVFLLFLAGSLAQFEVVVAPEGSGLTYEPFDLTIEQGQTVTWRFAAAGFTVYQSSTGEPEGFQPGTPLPPSSCANQASGFSAPSGFTCCMDQGSTFTMTFDTVGEFWYHERAQCELSGMKAVVRVVPAGVLSPAPGEVVINVGQNNQLEFFPTPLVVNTGTKVWFKFLIAGASVAQTVSGTSDELVPNGIASGSNNAIDSFFSHTFDTAGDYWFNAFPWGGDFKVHVIVEDPHPGVPAGAPIVRVGPDGNNAFDPSAQSIMNGDTVYFVFDTYGPYRVQETIGDSCVASPGGLDTLYQAPGRIVPYTVTGNSNIFFFTDATFCGEGMTGTLDLGVPPPTADAIVVVSPQGVGITYSPNSVTIFVGGTVRWDFDAVGHTVTSISDPNLCDFQVDQFDSGFLPQGSSFSRTFDTVGTYQYGCKSHCSFGMSGVVNVIPRSKTVIHGPNGNPEFDPQILNIFTGETVCWSFETAGDVVQSDYWQSCNAADNGFNSGFTEIGGEFCQTFTTPGGYPYYDSQNCANGMYGIVIVSDPATIDQEGNGFDPRFITVPVGTSVTWNFPEAGWGIVQVAGEEQLQSNDPSIRCVPLADGFGDANTLIPAGTIWPNENGLPFNEVGEFVFIDPFHCGFPEFNDAWGKVTVFDPFFQPTPEPTTEAPTEAPTCPPEDPCAIPKKKTVVNFYFADILAGHKCSNCNA